MSTAIGPGSLLLLCVEIPNPPALSLGAVYECADVFPDCDPTECRCGGTLGITLAGVKTFREDMAFCAHIFVPAGRRGDFEPMLKCEPVKEDA